MRILIDCVGVPNTEIIPGLPELLQMPILKGIRVLFREPFKNLMITTSNSKLSNAVLFFLPIDVIFDTIIAHKF